MGIKVRPMDRADVGAACRILNDIIHIGGTTAFESQVDEAGFARMYLHGDDMVACHVALDDNGLVAGFQWIGRNGRLADTCADIATFARPSPSVPGIGRALFARTAVVARKAGFSEINATIRADNASGLGYYAKMGFQDHSVQRAVPLRDGTPVDRNSKRYLL